MDCEKLERKAEKLLARCRKKRLRVATAESCTGGMIAALLTAIPGSSDVFERGFVSYSNAAKQEMLDVDAAVIAKKGAVSAEVAAAMARGALAYSKADLAVAVTGVAGPGGGTKEKPVGLVYIAVASRRHPHAVAREYRFKGKRAAIRAKTADKALAMLRELQDFL